MAEAQSVTTFVMEAQLPWPDDAPAADALGSLDPVILYVAGQQCLCTIRKISTLGTTIRGVGTQAPGELTLSVSGVGHAMGVCLGTHASVPFKDLTPYLAPGGQAYLVGE